MPVKKRAATRPARRPAKRTPVKVVRKAAQRSGSGKRAAKATTPIRKASGPTGASIEHQIKVGEQLTENVEGHAARTDSPQFVLARATLHKIIGSLSPNP